MADDLVISVGGDISSLETSLADIPAVAQDSAAKIQAAFDALPSATDGVEQSLANLNNSLAETGQGAEEAAGHVETIPPVLHDTSEASAELTDKFKELVMQGLELAGITFTLEAVKEAIIGSLEAFGELQTASVAMTAMTHNAQGVADALAKIPELANQIGASIGSLENAFTKFTRYGVDLQQIPAVLRSIADGAMASGIGFDQAAMAWERAANTGALAARSLQNMGVNLQDVARAMGMTGASSADVTKAFKGIQDQSDGTTAATQRLNILLAAVPDSIKGLAESADTTTKSFQQLANTVTDAKESIGQALTTIGNGVVLKGLEVAIGQIAIALLGAINVVGEFADAVVGVGKIVIDTFVAIGQAMIDASAGNFKKAVADIIAGGQQIADDWMAMGQKMAGDFTQTGAIVDKIWGGMSAAADDSNKATTEGVQKTTEAIGQMNQVLLNAQNTFNNVAAAFASGSAGLSTYTKALDDLDKAQKDFNGGVEQLSTALLLQVVAYDKIKASVANASIDLEAIVENMAKGMASATQYSAALIALNKAQEDLDNGFQNAHTAYLLAVDDFSKLSVSLVNAKTFMDAVALAFQNGRATISEMTAAVDAYAKVQAEMNNGLVDLATQEAKAVLAFRDLGTAADNASVNLQAVWAEYQKQLATLPQLIDATLKYVAAQTAAAGGVESTQLAEMKLTAEHDKLNLALINANNELAAAQKLYEEDGSYAGLYAQKVQEVQKAQDALTGAHKTATTAVQSHTTAMQALNGTMQTQLGQLPPIYDAWDVYAQKIAGATQAVTTNISTDADWRFALAQSQGVADQFGTTINAAAVNMGGLTNAMTATTAAAPGLASALRSVGTAASEAAQQMQEFDAAMGDAGSGSLGQQLDRSMNARIGGLNISLRPGDTFQMPFVGNPTHLVGVGAIGAGYNAFTQADETQGIFGGGTVQFIPHAAQALTNAATALTNAAQTQQDAATLAYEAAKASGTAATAIATAATANDSIAASVLAAADAANAAAFNASVIGTQVLGTVTQATQTVAAATALVGATVTAVAPALGISLGTNALVPGAPTPVTPAISGPGGSNTLVIPMPVNTGPWDPTVSGNPRLQLVLNNSGPIVGSGGMDQLVSILGDNLVKQLQTQGIRLTRA